MRHTVVGMLAAVVGIAAARVSLAAESPASEAWRTRVEAKLLTIYDSSATAHPAAAGPLTHVGSARFNENGWVQADVHYDCGRESPAPALAAAGLSISAAVRLGSYCAIEGWVAPKLLAQIATTAGITRITLPLYAVQPHLRSHAPAIHASSANEIDHNGVTIMHADQFVSQTGTHGGGAKVGVQSGGISSLSVIQSRGELPAVQVVKPSDGVSSPVGDEGTVLLEEIHAVAPGAALAYCGPGTFVEYASCLGQLVAAGANILVDDIMFPQEDLLSSDSSQVRAIEQLLAQNPGVALFSAAGNYNGSYWEGTYSPVSLSSLGLAPLTCPSGSTTQTDHYVAQFSGGASQLLTVLQSTTVPITFAWSDPPNQNASQFDVYWVNSQDGTKSGCLAAGSATDNQVSQNEGLSGGSYTLYIATPDASVAGKFLKLWVGGDGLTTLSDPTVGSIVTPQAFAAGTVSVGAVNGSDGIGNHIESFSSIGPVTLLFPQETRIQAPILVAPDGINVDASGTDFAGNLFPDGNFYGTSAAAPNAAAIAALIHGAFPKLTAAQLIEALKSGATQLGSAPPDGTFGYGRIDAMGALGTFPTPTMTSLPASASLTAGTGSTAYAFTVSGTGALHFTVNSSNTSVIPAAAVAAGSPGVTISPSDCGATTLTCTLTILPAHGPGGTVNLTVATLDGANRSASSTIAVSVTGDQSAPTNTSPESTPSSGGGGALDERLLVVLLLVVSYRAACRRPAHGREAVGYSQTPASLAQ
jgi:Subtilase family